MEWGFVCLLQNQVESKTELTKAAEKTKQAKKKKKRKKERPAASPPPPPWRTPRLRVAQRRDCLLTPLASAVLFSPSPWRLPAALNLAFLKPQRTKC